VTPVLRAQGLRKLYGARRVLDDATISLGSGEVVALIGANGAGKTTLLRILLGLIHPTGGRVTWTGTGGPIPPGTADHFGGAHTLPPHVRASRWARIVSRGEARCEERRPIRQLSRGSRQLLGLRTTLARADLSAVLLDEPWEGLDPDGARWLSDRIAARRAEGCVFLVSSHRLHDLAGLCDRYAFLAGGRLVIRSAAEISADRVKGEDLLKEMDRIRVRGLTAKS
jgi:ABC-2 type transport system ATP-binding protein